ncbi:DedA family protein [uncultured Pseudonocardia sp.]|uniref:DedA family protein n=1 Tax=uncultured Pseudonocardia sp. TaxID=211455 RepID=UPI0026190C75|nr:DedA family protein [uncultured Pseudonocardia sp.]
MLISDLASGPALAVQQLLAVNILDPTSLLSWAGAAAVLVVLFAETGLLVGFFLPGDSLLFTAGLFCSTAAGAAVHLQLGWVLPAAAVGALLGAQVGYLIGHRAGPALLARDRPRLAAGMRRAQQLLDRYGYGKAIVLARFIPVVRTVLNPLAGAIGVPSRIFALWQVVGGLVWSVGVTLAGYALGSVVPNVDRYLLPVIAAIVIVSLIPLGLELLRSRRRPARHTAAATDEQVR